jgi:hypothetical protein
VAIRSSQPLRTGMADLAPTAQRQRRVPTLKQCETRERLFCVRQSVLEIVGMVPVGDEAVHFAGEAEREWAAAGVGELFLAEPTGERVVVRFEGGIEGE